MWEEDEEALHVDVELVRGKVIREAGARDNALIRFHHQYEKHPVTILIWHNVYLLCSTNARTHAYTHAHAHAHTHTHTRTCTAVHFAYVCALCYPFPSCIELDYIIQGPLL